MLMDSNYFLRPQAQRNLKGTDQSYYPYQSHYDGPARPASAVPVPPITRRSQGGKGKMRRGNRGGTHLHSLRLGRTGNRTQASQEIEPNHRIASSQTRAATHPNNEPQASDSHLSFPSVPEDTSVIAKHRFRKMQQQTKTKVDTTAIQRVFDTTKEHQSMLDEYYGIMSAAVNQADFKNPSMQTLVQSEILTRIIESLNSNPDCDGFGFWNIVNVLLKRAVDFTDPTGFLYPLNEIHLENGYFSLLQIKTLFSPDSFIWDWVRRRESVFNEGGKGGQVFGALARITTEPTGDIEYIINPMTIIFDRRDICSIRQMFVEMRVRFEPLTETHLKILGIVFDSQISNPKL